MLVFVQEMPYTSDDVHVPVSQEHWDGDTWLDRLVLHWHRILSPQQELLYLSGVRNLEATKTFPRWSLCAGSGLLSHFFSSLTCVWKHLYEIEIVFPEGLISEYDKRKQRFLKSQHSPAFMVHDMKELNAEEGARI